MSTSANSVRVLIVAGIRLYREGLAQALGHTKWITVEATAPTAESALQKIQEHRPEVILLDLALTGARSVIEQAVHHPTSIQVVALAVDDCDEALLSAAEVGVAGYVPRDGSLDDLLAAIRHALDGEFMCSPRVARRLVSRMQSLAIAHGPHCPSIALSEREFQIAELLDHGLSNKEIAARLWIEESTVKNHIHNILIKLGARRRGEAAALLRPLLLHRSLSKKSLTGDRP